ncbi:MAG TPA: ribosome-associated translation inhibitor RaiA [Candidatus Hydrogenedentes bacterium]|nr:ribosome-associated translation inhibitor RaiA [Candidatus Hydrogenedentota bacterium]HRK34829.1 ribosome-associated translation inhibitor RaiA [Candidatus Hydrogenedentota bacterium]
MRVSLAGRHLEITDAIRTHVESQLDKVRHHFDRVIDVDVVLSVEKHRHTADITVHANGVRIHGKDTSDNMYASVDTVVDKIDRQILKFKDRSHRYQPRKSKEAINAEIGEMPVLAEEAAKEAAVGHRRIVREPITMKPMSVDEAAMQLELRNDTFIVFRNADSLEVNVIYAKHDGTLALIEPEK